MQAGEADSDRARHALEHICERYWYPLYAYVRRLGYDPHAAADATQSFFLHLHQTALVTKVDPAAGRFRTFLLTSLKYHLLSERKRESALKRGGGATLLSLDEADAEGRFVNEPCDGRSPDLLFERSWVMNLLDEALGRLEKEYQSDGHQALFDHLQPARIKEEPAPSYRAIAEVLGVTEGSVKVSIHRMRQRYREILTGLVASTVPEAGEVEQELRHLLKVLAG